LETDDFPFEAISDIAELESWRKELHRPPYHIHKWWAQRLGSVFRAILISAFSPPGTDVMKAFYEPLRLSNAVIFDPFMGSGTTIGEALKLGARAIGRDINPVAHFAVTNSFAPHVRKQVIATFHAIEQDTAPQLKSYYKTRMASGELTDVLYYFWVKTVPCPRCRKSVDLFSTFVFAKHAYPTTHPLRRVLCPGCGNIQNSTTTSDNMRCTICKLAFDPEHGPVNGSKATCRHCNLTFAIVKAVQATKRPPSHRLYAKLALLPDGNKAYLPADDFDRSLFLRAVRHLNRLPNCHPVVRIEPGYNTNQILNYEYRFWHQLFNERQLLCHALLLKRILKIEDGPLRNLFLCLFSGTLEFNNLFTSFKGEGTGAVRHMFSHHVLKPERTPLEANLWGTPRSSGAFSTLFERRLLRALDYLDAPFEIRAHQSRRTLSAEKVFGVSDRMGHDAARSFRAFGSRQLYLSCGDSGATDLPDAGVDAVVTDPPFFDNVHYSELADFFYVWQRYALGKRGTHRSATTRSPREVQTSDPVTFSRRLGRVLLECQRVLKPQGLLAFTYHHSRPEGWQAVLTALHQAGFTVSAAQPIKSEMSVGQPKHQTKEPIDLDVVLVCRKRGMVSHSSIVGPSSLAEAARTAQAQASRFARAGRSLSRNDILVILMAQIVRWLSRSPLADDPAHQLEHQQDRIQSLVDEISERSAADAMKLVSNQYALYDSETRPV